MKAHPVYGFNLARQNGIEDLVVLSIIRWHHERVDGKGYPDGLTRDAIPLLLGSPLWLMYLMPLRRTASTGLLNLLIMPSP
ncbi:HD domain-containing phosphohydrolase [Acetomicrobium sp.]|uniref:HD domain-containing phosphohydrolase n=1 Tax=Acetomicrobium sp. TaxID=1872099 RepID=UPI002871172A|nr:HD domain-containing phosphohydrolase [Acetomicrobium sp.]MDR9770480.1 HD domain-containing phosphohydrolase [Acetomicrobium sp.]